MKPKVVFFNRVLPPSQEATAVLAGDLIESLSSEVDFETVSSGTGRRFRGLDRLSALIRSAWKAMTMNRQATALCWTDPPFQEVLVGLICRLRGISCIVTVQDCYPEIFVALGWLSPAGIPMKTWRALRKFALGKARAVVCLSRDGHAVLSKAKVANLQVIPNWSVHGAGAAHEAIPAQTLNEPKGPLVLVYGGNAGYAFDFDLIRKVVEQVDPSRFHFVFRVWGRKVAELKNLADHHPHVEVRPPAAAGDMAETLREGDLHLILTPEEMYGLVTPSKIYTAAASGKPVMAALPKDSCLHGLIKEVPLGYSTSSGDVRGFLDVLETAWDDYSKGSDGFSSAGYGSPALAGPDFAAKQRRDSVAAYGRLLTGAPWRAIGVPEKPESADEEPDALWRAE